MGEAKRRGSAADRAEQARERHKVWVKSLIDELELPAESKFMGYVIHSPDRDDYLAKIEDKKNSVARAYVPTPEAALVFADYSEACLVAESITKKTQIGVLFDVGNQLFVAFNEERQ